MRIDRTWCMPSKWTFEMKPIKEILERYVKEGYDWVDPFAGFTSPAEFSNDVNKDAPTKHHMDALEFLQMFEEGQFRGALYDPPYSVEMAKRRYKYNGYFDTATFTKYMSSCRKEIARVVELGGYVICFGWNSNGIGMKYGFEMKEVLMVAHGSYHYDTIVTVEEKIEKQEKLEWLKDDV